MADAVLTKIAEISVNRKPKRPRSWHCKESGGINTTIYAAHIRIHKSTKGTAVIASSTVLRAQFGSR